ncbi:MAG: hypothetical protein R6V03_02795 [Kiritimatiellia bacterium]
MKSLNLRYIILESLSGVAAWRDGDVMAVRVLPPPKAQPALPRGYAHDDPPAAVFQLRPNTEGDEPFESRRWKSVSFQTELDSPESWLVRVRFRGSGWLPARTEFWRDVEIKPGRGGIAIDTSDCVICMDSGTLEYIRCDVLKAPGDSCLRISGISAVEHDSTTFWETRIDRFGQRLKGRWEGKVKSEDDLKADASAALPDPLPGNDRDRWGGWKKGPRFNATGSFDSARDDNGRWWLVTPEGNPYLSLGACCTGVGSVGMAVPGRESWFEEIPAKDGELADAWRADPRGGFGGAELYPRKWHGHARADDPGVTQFNYLVANLVRSFGSDWYERWCGRTEARLDAWGLTSLGCWSDLEFAEARRRPAVMPAERLSPPDWTELVSTRDPVWPVKRVPDVFHPGFESAVEGCFKDLERFRNKPWVLGFFMGNEQNWSSLVTPLALPLAWESRRVFIDGLRGKYGAIDALNRAWLTRFASWDRLAGEQINAHYPGLSETGVADCDAFLEKFCDRYFGLVRKELKRAVPQALFWGCRYLALPPRAAVLRGSARHMDLVSINWYLWHKQEPEDAARFLGHWHELCGGKPLAMTEWSFEMTNERLLASRALFTTEAERAELAGRYIRACFSLPFVVGLHWFQWPDQPILGRGRRDGERSAFGLVDVTDRPHEKLVGVIRENSRRMYEMHSNGR